MDLGFRMHAERTPNPDSIKWVLGQPVAGEHGSASFEGSVDPALSPLASSLLAIEGVERVYLGPSFITVGKAASAEWTEVPLPTTRFLRRNMLRSARTFSMASPLTTRSTTPTE